MARLRLRRNTFYYRAKLPADLRQLLGRKEFTYSLHTADADSAQALCLEMSARQLRLCRVLRQSGAMMTKEQLDKLIAHYMERHAENREQDAMNFGRFTPEFTQQRLRNLADDLKEAETALVENNLETVEELARYVVSDAGADVSFTSEDFMRLCYRLLNVRVDMLRSESDRLLPKGQPNGFPMVAPSDPVASTPNLSALVSEFFTYREQRDPLPPRTLIEYRAALAAMLNLLGDVTLDSVRNRDAQDFAVAYSQLPNRWRQTYRGKSAREVLELTKGQDLPKIEPGTFNKEIGLVKGFWKWACLRYERQFNPMAAVTALSVGNTRDKRHPFTDDDLKALAVVIEAERERRPERYWIATLLAYTGARLEEIAQLRKQDVVTLEGVPCVYITEEAGSTKTEASQRWVPIHSAVLAKGFLAYTQGRTEGARLFFDESNSVNRFGPAISKWFARVKKPLNLPDDKKKVLHSFRHTMADRLREAQVDHLLRREIMGHAYEDVEDQVYGSVQGMSIKAKQVAIEKVRLPI